LCGLIKLKLETKEVNVDTDNSKVKVANNNEKYVFLYKFDGKACYIANMTGNNFEIVIY
jgi:hypothetical protein